MMLRRGQKLSEETKRKISATLKGQKLSEETRRKLSVAASKRIGEKNSRWKGGRIKHDGYVVLWSPNHPYADVNGYVQEHRLVMEAHIGRVLLPTEVVHHINGKRDDNRIENLMLFSSNSDHARHHRKSN